MVSCPFLFSSDWGYRALDGLLRQGFVLGNGLQPSCVDPDDLAHSRANTLDSDFLSPAFGERAGVLAIGSSVGQRVAVVGAYYIGGGAPSILVSLPGHLQRKGEALALLGSWTMGSRRVPGWLATLRTLVSLDARPSELDAFSKTH